MPAAGVGVVRQADLLEQEEDGDVAQRSARHVQSPENARLLSAVTVVRIRAQVNALGRPQNRRDNTVDETPNKSDRRDNVCKLQDVQAILENHIKHRRSLVLEQVQNGRHKEIRERIREVH